MVSDMSGVVLAVMLPLVFRLPFESRLIVDTNVGNEVLSYHLWNPCAAYHCVALSMPIPNVLKNVFNFQPTEFGAGGATPIIPKSTKPPFPMVTLFAVNELAVASPSASTEKFVVPAPLACISKSFVFGIGAELGLIRIGEAVICVSVNVPDDVKLPFVPVTVNFGVKPLSE